MEESERARIKALLVHAQLPEEVFGWIQGEQAEQLEAVKKSYRALAKIVHPDTANPDSADHSSFAQLSHFWELAQVRITKGVYGTHQDTPVAFKPFRIATATREYLLEQLRKRGDICQLYAGSWPEKKKRAIFKIVVHPQDNDLVENEARLLTHLAASPDYDRTRHFVSQLLDSFLYQETGTGIMRRVNVLKSVDHLFSLAEVKTAYPQGIDPKDMAWIWRRLLLALRFAHSNNVIHGAVLPVHVLLQPEEHGVVLIDWSYGVIDPTKSGERISATCAAYRSWYPAEVFAKKEPTPALDLAMAAACMIDLLGGKAETQWLPEHIPWQIKQHLQGCMLPQPLLHAHDAGLVLKRFDELIQSLWGPKKFHPFHMPAHSSTFNVS